MSGLKVTLLPEKGKLEFLDANNILDIFVLDIDEESALVILISETYNLIFFEFKNFIRNKTSYLFFKNIYFL